MQPADCSDRLGDFVRTADGGLEVVNDLGEVTGATSIDLADGNVVVATLTGDPAFTFAASTANPGRAQSFTLVLQSTGGATVTWSSPVLWAGGAAPSLSAGAAAVDVFTFFTIDDGASWFGFVAGQDMS